MFAALSMALEPLRIPIFFWPGQYFHFWEVPVIIAFFLFGFKVGFSVAILDAIGYITLFPDGAGIIGPPWRIVVILTMFTGLLLAKKIVSHYFIINDKNLQKEKRWTKPVLFFTVFAIISRVVIMPFVDFAVYKFLLPFVIGHSIPDIYIMSLMPAIIFFNIVVPLYTIPIAYLTSKTIHTNMKIGNAL